MGQRGDEKKRARRNDSDRRRFSSWTLDIAFLRSPTGSFFLCICSFRSGSSYSLVPPSLFLRSHLLAGVINDLTDTLHERWRESVKQVVIKADAVFLGGRRRKETKREKKRGKEKRTESV